MSNSLKLTTPYVVITNHRGMVFAESRLVYEDGRIIAEGRVLEYDADGVLTKDSGWERYGIEKKLLESEQSKWVEFLK